MVCVCVHFHFNLAKQQSIAVRAAPDGAELLMADGSLMQSFEICAHVLDTSDKNMFMIFDDSIILQLAFNSISTIEVAAARPVNHTPSHASCTDLRHT